MKPRSKPAGTSRKSNAARRRPRATTAEIVPNLEDAKTVPAKWKSYYASLLRFRRDLIRRKEVLASAAREEKPTFSEHMADAGTDHFDRDFALSLLSSEQTALYEVEQALNRIRTGTYGKCEVTNRPIAPERLKAIPWTRYSAEAERELEKSGRFPKVKLADALSIRREETSSRVSEESK